MKLVYVANSIIPSRAANSVHVMKMCDALAKAGYDVTLMVPEVGASAPGEEYAAYGVPPSFRIQRLPWLKSRGRGWWFAWSAFKAIKRLGADRVYGRHLPSLVLPALSGLPTAYEAHAPVTDTMGKSGTICLKLLAAARGFEKLVVISEALAAWYRDNTALNNERLVVAHDAASPAVAMPGEPSARELDSSFHLGYVGQLYAGKGMEMIARLAAKRPKYRFTVIGGDDSDISHWRNQLRHLSNVCFTGFMPQAEAIEHLSGFDAVLAPYQSRVATAGGGGDVARWMSPLKIFEYMAAAKPIVVSDLPVLREVLVDGENAMLCDPDNAEHWCVAIDRLNSDRSLCERIGRNAKRQFLQCFTWEARAIRISKEVFSDSF